LKGKIMTDKSTPLAMQANWQTGDETEMVAAARRDLTAFSSLYDRYVQPIYRYLLSRLGSIPEAEDITAQTFLAAMEAFPRYHHQGHFAAWLFSIARNKTIDYFRSRRAETLLEEAEHLPDATDLLQQAVSSERSAAVTRLLKTLPEDERELLRLRYLAELSFAEMGILLGRSEEATKKSLYRLLARLQALLEVNHE
jgi:RNA polymerase sigma-70 factor, ECF subfamily